MRRYKGFDDDECINSSVFKRYHKWDICNKTGKCNRCPWHDGENWRKRPRTDNYKNKNRKTIRTLEII